MKKTFLISLLSLAAFSMNAQTVTTDKNAVCKKFPHMPAGATAVWPSGTYTPTQDPSCPPCYEYKSKRTGVMIMECPYLNFPAEKSSATASNAVMEQNYEPVTRTQPNTDRIVMQSQNSYTGNYPAVCKRDPDMPANAKPVWPAGTYTATQDPSCPPCYEYKSKRTGVMIMECPFLRFPASEK